MRGFIVVVGLLACRPAVAVAPTPVSPRDVDGEAMFAMTDRCPGEPEDFDGFEDEDGCVDRDNDGDGIPDAHEYVNGRWSRLRRR